MYDTMRDDYILWDARRVEFNAKVKLMRKYWFVKENFTKEEMHKLRLLDLLPSYDIDAELESDAQMIAEYEENM